MMPSITPPATTAEFALRLLIAIVSGAIIGLNRELAGKAAGLRTHALVSLGAAAGCAVGLSIPGDPTATSRVLQGIMAGVGFIGGGVILHDRRGTVHGLTTAASIWVVAAAGMAAGTGLFAAAGTVVGFALVVLVAGEVVDRALHRRLAGRPADDAHD